MISILSIGSIIKSRAAQFGVVALLSLGVGAYLHHRFTPPKTITTIVHDTKQVQVEVPVLTTKIVDRIVTDPNQQALINKLIKENDALKLRVTQISTTTATNTSMGGTDQRLPGTIIPTPSSTSTGGKVGSSSYTFKDYQLNATYTGNGKEFNYLLSQNLIITSSTGFNKEGNKVGLVELNQVTPKGLVKIPTDTTYVFADERAARWFVSPRIQGGLGIDQDKTKSGFIGLQLLKKGTSKDPKDISFAVGTVGILLRAGVVEPVVLPFSYNVGHLPKQPFSNLWLGASIDRNKKIGLTLTTTF